MKSEFEQPTKITIETYGGEVITHVETNRSDLDVHQMFELVRRALVGHGYSEKTIDDYLGVE